MKNRNPFETSNRCRFILCLMAGFFLLFGIPGTLFAGPEFKSRDDLFDVDFIGPDRGWVCGRWGSVLHSPDGGRTWAKQNTGTDFTLTAIDFIDARNGWAVGANGTILHTADGGKTWIHQKSPVDFYHMDVCFISPREGWIVSERTHILHTDNGGASWRVQFHDEDYILKSVSFCDADTGWAVGEFGYIYHTTDGGILWNRQAGNCELDEESGAMTGDAFLFDVTAVNPRTALASGIEGLVKRTTDGGGAWESINAGVPESPLFTIASNESGSILVAGGKGVCRLSTDGGITWRDGLVRPGIEYGWIYGIGSAGNGSFALCGDEGAIFMGSPQNGWERVKY